MKANYMPALALAVVVISAGGTEASAQQNQKYLFKQPPGISKYEEQHSIDVGDVQGHQLRVYSLHSVYAQEAPVFDGVKVKES
jgi:hypothetical protein